MNRNKFVIIGLLLICVGCNQPPIARIEKEENVQADFLSDKKVRISNFGKSSLRVKHVYSYGGGGPEKCASIKRLEPDQQLEYIMSGWQYEGFYILTMEGQEIAFFD